MVNFQITIQEIAENKQHPSMFFFYIANRTKIQKTTFSAAKFATLQIKCKQWTWPRRSQSDFERKVVNLSDGSDHSDINDSNTFSEKEELIKMLRQLNSKTDNKNEMKFKKEKRQFDWTRVSKRHLLLKFMYFGWDYQGYATQDCTEETIESHLFKALKQCCLIENRETSNYHRCGRTDSGVSAFSQVISIDLRSKHQSPDETNIESELPYCKMLNRLLPIHIRCYAWCHVGSEVSARFDCTDRSYSYYFPRGTLNISAMSEAVKHLEGTHDFRNLCKMDVGNGVTNFVRTIKEAQITPALLKKSQDNDLGFQMMKLIIRSRGFLWHQIRCIMAVLLMVGEGNEAPSIVTELLDIARHPCKPQYHMANPLPLTLATAEYENNRLIWNIEEEEMEVLGGQLQGLFTEYAVKSAMVRDALQMLGNLAGSEISWKRHVTLFSGTVSKVHAPLLTRPTCMSLADRVEKRDKRKRNDEDTTEEASKRQNLNL